MEELRDHEYSYIGGITVPANDFSAVTTIQAQKRDHIISIGFKPSDNRRHEVYPVWLAPVDSDLGEWKVCFYNRENHEVVLNIYGVEKG